MRRRPDALGDMTTPTHAASGLALPVSIRKQINARNCCNRVTTAPDGPAGRAWPGQGLGAPSMIRDAARTRRFSTRRGPLDRFGAVRSATVGGRLPELLAPCCWARTSTSHHFGDFWLEHVALDPRRCHFQGFRLRVVFRGRVLVLWVRCFCNHDFSSTDSRRTEAQNRRHGQLHRSQRDFSPRQPRRRGTAVSRRRERSCPAAAR